MFATLVGVSAAVSAAWLGGWYDALITGITDVMLGFPGLLLAIVAVAFFGVGLGAPVVALAVAYAPYFARLTRSVALRERSQAYISALTALGYGGLRISLRHLLPNIAPLILAQAAVSFGYAMVDFAAISFLGLGVQPPTADWGSMVALGQSGILQGHAQVSLAAGAMIVLAVVAFNLLGEGIADRTARGRR
jgi:peptide/nickel transport system permease protein